jgi:hypothetical protein
MNEQAGTTFGILGSVDDHDAVPEPPATPANEEAALSGDDVAASASPQPSPVTSFEDRIRRLEDQVENLRDTRKLEDRVTERIAKRLERKQANSAIKVPVATGAEPTKSPPMAAIAPPQDLPPVVVIEGKSAKQPWLIVDIVTEFKAMLQMFLDIRYRVFYMTWQTKVYPPMLLGMFFLSWLLLSGSLIGSIIDRVAQLVIAFFLYKVLSREAHRYREIAPQIRR